MHRLCFPEIGEVNEVGETPLVKTTDRFSKLCEEYNDICRGIDTLKCVQAKFHIDDTVQSVQFYVSIRQKPTQPTCASVM